MERVHENVQSSQLSNHISTSDFPPITNQSSFVENKIKTLDSALNDVDDFLYNTDHDEVPISRSTDTLLKPLASNGNNEQKSFKESNNNKVSFYMGNNFPEDSKLLANPKGIIKSFLPIVAASDPDKFESYRKLCMAHVNEYYKHLKGEINMLCLVCNVSCQHWNTLQRHLQTHINFRPFICELCQRTFYSQNKLKRHQIIHNDIKPYKCPFCDRRVGRTEHLKRHLLVHTDDKPFGCSGCSHTTKRLDGIRRHIKRKHGVEGAKIIHIELPVDIEMLNKFREAVTSVEEMKNFENKKKFEDASKDMFDNVIDKKEFTLIKNQGDLYQGFHDTFHEKDFKKTFLSDDLNLTEALPNEKENSINGSANDNSNISGKFNGFVKSSSPFDSFNETKNCGITKINCNNITNSDKVNIQKNGKSDEENFLSNDASPSSSTMFLKENKTIMPTTLENKNTLKTSYTNNNCISKDINSLNSFESFNDRLDNKNYQKPKTNFEQIEKNLVFNKSLKSDNYKNSNKSDVQENFNNLGKKVGNNNNIIQKSGQQGKKNGKNCSKSSTVDLADIPKSHNCSTSKRNDDSEVQKLNYIDNNLICNDPIYNTVYSKKSNQNDSHKILNNFSVLPPQHNHFHHPTSQEPFINNYHAEMMLSHYFQSHQRFTPPIWGFTNQNYPNY